MSNATNMILSRDGRAALRRAVRNHAAAPGLLGDRKVSGLSKAELLEAADMLGIDASPFSLAGGFVASPSVARLDHADDAAEGAEDEDTVDDENQATLTLPLASELDAEAPVDTVPGDAVALRKKLAGALIEGDFTALDTTLQGLLREANKPPRVEIETILVEVPAGSNAAALAVASAKHPVPSPVSETTAGKLFGANVARGPQAGVKVAVYTPSVTTPQVDGDYVWPAVTGHALAAMRRGRNVWLYGPAGTGKSTFAEQLAARTGRPLCVIACDDTLEAPELVGMVAPVAGGGTAWRDGALTAAIRVPHTIVLIDEITVARPGALMVFQSVLASGFLAIRETGEIVKVAPGVRFMAADNTNGTGGGSLAGYEGTRRINRATLDRFAAFLALDFMPPATEARVVAARTGCTPQLATMLVECAVLTRKASVSHGIGLRRLLAWAEALTDGVAVAHAFDACVANFYSDEDREAVKQCCLLGLDRKAIATALEGKGPAPVEPPVDVQGELSPAARDFA